MYIWQASNWTDFSYQPELITAKLNAVLVKQKQLIGNAKKIPEGLDRQAEMDALIQNALQTSEIEGEKLNVGSVRSSVARHLGLEQAGQTNSRCQTESLIAMLTDATSQLETPIT
jgi:Fic family protein